MKTIRSRVAAREAGPTSQKIPRRLIQTFKRARVPEGMYRAARSWLDLNPSYEYRFFNDEGQREFIAEHFGPDMERCYEALPAGAFRADLWRYCELYVNGGVYVDLDTVCRTPLDGLLRKGDEFVVAHDIEKIYLFNAFICCTPGHPFLKNAIEYARERILSGGFQQRLERNPQVPYWIVGPGGLAAAINLTLGRPESTSFNAGRHRVAGFSFRIMRKIHEEEYHLRRIMDASRTVIMCKYPGYLEDLVRAGGSHWETGAVDSRAGAPKPSDV